MSSAQTLRSVSERAGAGSNNTFELLLFHLGETGSGQHELFGINVFKVREILVMPQITQIVNSPPHVLGVANIRGQIITVIDLAAIAGCTPRSGNGILLVTEFARSTQAFAVEDVTEIVRVDWKNVLAAEGKSGGLVTSIARIDGDVENTRLAQVLDVERVLLDVMPDQARFETSTKSLGRLQLPPGTVLLAADDSAMARSLIEKGLSALGIPYFMAHTGKEAWDHLQLLATQAQNEGKRVSDKVALVLTDIEMPEMDGFTLTRNIKADPQYAGIPVVIHSSLTGTTNEIMVRNAGADAYIAKFAIDELAQTLRDVMGRQ